MKRLLKNISPFNNHSEMPTACLVVKKILAFFVCYAAGLLIAEGAVILLHFAFGKNMLVGDVFDEQTITLIKYYGYIIVAGIALLYWKCIEKKPLSEMGLTNRLEHYLIGAFIGILLISLSVLSMIRTGNLAYLGTAENADISLIIRLVGGFIVQGAAEEMLCRGIVLHALKEKTSPMIAVNVSTLTFIIPHLSSLIGNGGIYAAFGILNLWLISTVFSFFTIGFHSIWAACGLHSFWNATLYAFLGLNLSGNDKTVTAVLNLQSVGNNIWNGGAYGIEASAVTTAVLAIAAVLTGVAFRKTIFVKQH